MDLQENASSSLVGKMSSSYEENELIFGRHKFIHYSPATAIPILVVLTLATLMGTFGNVITLTLVCTRNVIRSVERVFIVNLAISDMYVTAVADPMGLIAKVEGEEFFNKIPGLCQTIASLCTVSCVTSLMTIGLMSLNRFFCVCNHEKYERVFTKRNCICMCISVYFVGGFLVLMNAAGIGDHGFDRKSLECIWDRMATYPYTIAFSITLVWLPSVVIGVCYLRIYLYVRAHNKRMRQHDSLGKATATKRVSLTRTLFVIYAVFITCWAPYALILVADRHNTFPHEVHIYITTFAHLHPSLTWIVYYITNRHYATAFRKLFRYCGQRGAETTEPSAAGTMTQSNGDKLMAKTKETSSKETFLDDLSRNNT